MSRQEGDISSSLSLYRSAIRLTQELPAARSGKYRPLWTDNDQVMAYGREGDMPSDQLIVLTNFNLEYDIEVPVAESHFVIGEVVLSSRYVEQNPQRVDLRVGMKLAPSETVVVKKA